LSQIRFMRCLRCGFCCRKTEMLLSTEDIERLEEKGYRQDFFVLIDEGGYTKLRNQQDHCVFFNIKDQCCTVYPSRPLGCRLYPVVYDERKGIIIDQICRAKSKLGEKQMTQQGRKVLRLLARIDAEAEMRRSAY
jgi:uncharacterized protein